MQALFVHNTPGCKKCGSVADLLDSKCFHGLTPGMILLTGDGSVWANLYREEAGSKIHVSSIAAYPWDLDKLSYKILEFFDVESGGRAELHYNETAGTFSWYGSMPGEVLADVCADSVAEALEYIFTYF